MEILPIPPEVTARLRSRSKPVLECDPLPSVVLGGDASPIDIGNKHSMLAAMPKRSIKQITLIDLGKKLNLSPRAVSQALHGGKCTVRISAETRDRVQALAKKLNYRPNRQAQILRKGTSGMVGIVAVQQFGYLIQQELFFARKYAEENALIPNIYLLPNRDDAACHRAVDFMLDSKVDSLLVIGEFFAKQHVERILDAKVPIVSMGSPNVPYVPRYYADKRAGFAMLARHLIEQGARKISLLISNPVPVQKRHWHSWCACTGAADAVREANEQGGKVQFELSPFNNEAVDIKVSGSQVHGYYATGYFGMKRLIEAGNIPDALMCQADNGVHGALLACAEYGIQVPREMLISGFEDDASSSAGLLPITSVSQPVPEMLRLAFTDLRSIIFGEQEQARRSVKLPCELRLRQSTMRSEAWELSQAQTAQLIA